MFTKQINERQFWKSFFAFYRKYPEIWDPRCDKYSIKEYKDIAYKALVAKMKDIDPNATVDSVKRKLNIFKSNYKREQKRRKITGSKSKLWYYTDLSFLPEMDKICSDMQDVPLKSDSSDFDISELTGSMPSDTPAPNYNQNTNTFSSQINEYLPNGFPLKPEHCVAKSEPSEHESSFNEDDNSCYPIIEPSVRLNQGSSVNVPYSETEDDAEVFSKSWARLYRRIPPSQQLHAKKLIDDILYEACHGRLDEDKVQIGK